MMDEPIIDIEALKRLLHLIGGDTGELGELLDEFLETAPVLVASISQAAAVGNRNDVRISAHTLKSNARDFGAMRLSRLCAALEQDCRGDYAVDLAEAACGIAQEERSARSALGSISINELD